MEIAIQFAPFFVLVGIIVALIFLSQRRRRRQITGAPDVVDLAPIEGNFIAKYWRGGFSLPASYWGFGFLVRIASVTFALTLSAWVERQSYEPTLLFVYLVALWSGLAFLTIWQVVGLWRSATRYEVRRALASRSSFWGGVAKFMVVIAVLQSLALAMNTAGPQIVETYQIAFEDDPTIPPGTIRLVRGGTEIIIDGGIKYGLAKEFAGVLSSAPKLTTVHLNSVGGRIGEAQKLHQQITDRHLDTYVASHCESACTLVLAAGKDRWILPGAQIGFHSAAFAGSDFSDSDWRRVLQNAGVDAGFINRAMSVPSTDMWYPTQDELLAARVVTKTADQGSFALSDAKIPTLDEIEADMRKASGVVDALHALDPAKAGAVYEIVHRAYLEGATAAETKDAVNQLIFAEVRANLPRAADKVVIDYGRLVAEQFAALGTIDAELCYQLAISDDPNELIYAKIPPDLGARETLINENVLRTAKDPPRTNPDRAQRLLSLVLQTLQSRLTESEYASLIAETALPRDKYRDYCAGIVGLYEEVTKLPEADSAILIRFLFSDS